MDATVAAPVAKEAEPSQDTKYKSKVKDAKAYKIKLKRHKDAVLSLHSQDGIDS